MIQYIKLNDYNKTHSHFPFDVAGMFYDGLNKYLIILQLQGEIVFESNKAIITEADKEYLELNKIKKLPGDVVCIFV